MKQAVTASTLATLPTFIGWTGGMELERHPLMALCLAFGAALTSLYLALKDDW